jgi:hypothetical protein
VLHLRDLIVQLAQALLNAIKNVPVNVERGLDARNFTVQHLEKRKENRCRKRARDLT